MEYLDRMIDEELDNKIRAFGAVLIRGPKWCGKTTTAKKKAASVLAMQNPDTKDAIMEISMTKPSELLKGDKPRLIDEWQVSPNLWDAIRYDVDKSFGENKYILTGSTVIPTSKIMHSGVGRFAFLDMRPLTLFESGISTGTISLNEIVNGNPSIAFLESSITYDDLAKILSIGGWPGSIRLDDDSKLLVPNDYLNVLCDADISSFDGVKRNPTLARFILRAYAKQISTIDSDKSLYDDVLSNYPDTSEKTIREYIEVLKSLFIIHEIPAWNPNIRSKEAIRRSPKKSFVDPSLGVAALNTTYVELQNDVRTFGLLFENLVNRDLSVYIQKYGGTLSHYRDRYGLECDNVIHYPDGAYALVEVKLGASGIDAAEASLLKLKSEIITKTKLKEPKALIIITGFGNAYEKASGVKIVPIGCLKD